MLVSSGLAYGLIPKYSCGDGVDGKPLPACTKVASGQPCCTKASNMGWRYLLLTIGAICLAIFMLRFVVFHFQESPKFLLSRGQDEKAVEVLHDIARFNKRECSINMDIFLALTDDDLSNSRRATNSPILDADIKQIGSSVSHCAKSEFGRYKSLFATRAMARVTILIWVAYVFDYWGFSIAGTGVLEGHQNIPC